MKTGVAKERLVAGEDFHRHRNRNDIGLLPNRCRLSTERDGGGVDVEWDRFLNSELDQRELFLRRRGERIEIQKTHTSGIIRKDQSGGPTLLASVHGSNS